MLCFGRKINWISRTNYVNFHVFAQFFEEFFEFSSQLCLKWTKKDEKWKNQNNRLTPTETWRHFAPTTADVERVGTWQTAFATGRINDLNNIFVDFLLLIQVELETNWNSIRKTQPASRSASEWQFCEKKIFIYFHTVRLSYVVSNLDLGQSSQGSIISQKYCVVNERTHLKQ